MAVEYLNNQTFESLIARFRNVKEGEPVDVEAYEQAQLDLFNAFHLLAKNIIRAFQFQLVDRDDALQEGVMICFEKLHRFDPAKGRAFNFCTTIILNHYRQLYRTAKNHNELKTRYHNHLIEKSKDMQAIRSKRGRNGFPRRNNYED